MQYYDDSRDYRLSLGQWGSLSGAAMPAAGRRGTFVPLILSATLIRAMTHHSKFGIPEEVLP